MTIAVQGTLIQDAESRRFGQGYTVFVLVNPGRGMPFEAQIDVGTTHDAALQATDLAKRYHRGDEVVIEGEMARVRSDHGVAAIVISGNAKVTQCTN